MSQTQIILPTRLTPPHLGAVLTYFEIADRFVERQNHGDPSLGLEIAWHCMRAGRVREATLMGLADGSIHIFREAGDVYFKRAPKKLPSESSSSSKPKLLGVEVEAKSQ